MDDLLPGNPLPACLSLIPVFLEKIFPGVKRKARPLHYPLDGGNMHFQGSGCQGRDGGAIALSVMQQMGQARLQLHSPGGWTEDSASAMTRQTFQAIVMQALQLRPIYREVFILCDIKGYSTSEAAAILAISEAAVTRRLRRARRLMARQSNTSADS